MSDKLKVGDRVTVCFDATIEIISQEGGLKIYGVKNNNISGDLCWAVEEDVQNKIMEDE